MAAVNQIAAAVVKPFTESRCTKPALLLRISRSGERQAGRRRNSDYRRCLALRVFRLTLGGNELRLGFLRLALVMFHVQVVQLTILGLAEPARVAHRGRDVERDVGALSRPKHDRQ